MNLNNRNGCSNAATTHQFSASAATAALKSVVANHLGANVRHYKFRTWTGEVVHNSLGLQSHLLAHDGKVVDEVDGYTIVKQGREAVFTVIPATLLSEAVELGDSIHLDFYKLRRFDGKSADGGDDPAKNGVRSFMLGGANTRFPVSWEARDAGLHSTAFTEGTVLTTIQNPFLRDMIHQMEEIPVDGGLRKVVNILVDAGARDLRFNDPTYEQGAVDPPSIACDVATDKFKGCVSIAYRQVPDVYEITLTPQDGEAVTHGDVYFDEMGDHLIDLIDDRKWLQAKVTLLKAAPKKRKPKEEDQLLAA